MFGTVVDIRGDERTGPFLVVCEHASNRVPEALAGLGLDEAALQSHIAWDPGAFQVACRISDRLEAALVYGTVSRLVFDCNRPPEAPDAIPVKSEVYPVPGNRNLDPVARQARVDGVCKPFESRLREAIQSRPSLAALVTVHSFTPVWFGTPRTVEIGILHGTDARLAEAVMTRARAESEYIVRLNEPYGPKDGVAHTLDLHGAGNGLMSVMIEVRNDLIAMPEDQTRIADMIADWVTAAFERLDTRAAE